MQCLEKSRCSLGGSLLQTHANPACRLVDSTSLARPRVVAVAASTRILPQDFASLRGLHDVAKVAYPSSPTGPGSRAGPVCPEKRGEKKERARVGSHIEPLKKGTVKTIAYLYVQEDKGPVPHSRYYYSPLGSRVRARPRIKWWGDKVEVVGGSREMELSPQCSDADESNRWAQVFGCLRVGAGAGKQASRQVGRSWRLTR